LRDWAGGDDAYRAAAVGDDACEELPTEARGHDGTMPEEVVGTIGLVLTVHNS